MMITSITSTNIMVVFLKTTRQLFNFVSSLLKLIFWIGNHMNTDLQLKEIGHTVLGENMFMTVIYFQWLMQLLQE